MTSAEPSPICAPKLDPEEEHFRIPSHHRGRSLFLRYLPAPDIRVGVVFYVHGGTFPSALSIAHRFDGRSWRDELHAAGYHVWAFGFYGFGRLSDPYPEMAEPAEDAPPLCRAEDASRQLEAATRFICSRHRCEQISIIAHSWGTIVTGRFAGRCGRSCPDMRSSATTSSTFPCLATSLKICWRAISLNLGLR
jgi:pimeloyl-ACP methyl ester carboxylesterase